MTDVLSTGGSMAYAVLGLAAFGVLVALGLAGMAFTKRRVPLVAFALVPILVLAIGGIGTWMNAGGVYSAIDAAEASSVAAIAMNGLWEAVGVDQLSRWAAAFLFAVSAACASAGAIAAGDDTRMTPIAGAMTGLATVVGAAAVGGYAATSGIGGEAYYLVGVILLGGFGVTIGAFRRALDEQASRVAGMRFVSAACMLLAVTHGSRALVMGSEAATFGPGGLTSQAKDLAGAITVYTDMAGPVVTLGWIALVAAIAIAFFGVFYELGEVVKRYTLVDVWATLGVLAILGGVRVVEHSRTDSLFEVATNGPAKEMFGKLGADLAPALLSIDKNVREVHPSDGGFGDVLFLKKNDDNSMSWVRVWKWDGTGWEEDETPLESAQLAARRPLLAAANGGDASAILDVLDKVPDGKALLLLRSSEVKGDVIVPSELTHLQVTFLELQKAGERDLEKELWTTAGAREYNWGPTSWYGEGQDGEPLTYAEAVEAATEAKGLHVLIPDDKARVKDVVNSCLPWIMDREGEGAVLSEKWCVLSGDQVEDVRTAASEIWPIPEPENTRMTVKKIEGDQLEEAKVVDRLVREVGAVDYCVGLLRDEGEEATGQLKLEVGITSRGKMGDIVIHEKSKVQSQAIARCVAKRFAPITFEMPEPPEEAAEEPKDGKKVEPPPLPKYEVLVDLRG